MTEAKNTPIKINQNSKKIKLLAEKINTKVEFETKVVF